MLAIRSHLRGTRRKGGDAVIPLRQPRALQRQQQVVGAQLFAILFVGALFVVAALAGLACGTVVGDWHFAGKVALSGVATAALTFSPTSTARPHSANNLPRHQPSRGDGPPAIGAELMRWQIRPARSYGHLIDVAHHRQLIRGLHGQLIR